MCSCQIFNNIKDYLAHDVKTNTKYQTVAEIELPSITICNTNWFRKSTLGVGDGLLFKAYADFFGKNIEENKKILNEV